MSGNLIGQILQGQFRVDSFIASGGMGAVYRVWDLKRNVPLAMKVLHADLDEDDIADKSFLREADALTQLTHPHIVHFYGADRTENVDFLLLQFINGPTLKQILRRQPGRHRGALSDDPQQVMPPPARGGEQAW